MNRDHMSAPDFQIDLNDNPDSATESLRTESYQQLAISRSRERATTAYLCARLNLLLKRLDKLTSKHIKKELNSLITLAELRKKHD